MKSERKRAVRRPIINFQTSSYINYPFMSVYINYIGTANPEHKIAQTQIAKFMANAQEMDEMPFQKIIITHKSLI